MQKISVGAVVAAVVLVCCAVPSLAQAPFNPAAVRSASDIPYSIQSIADGVVVLDVSIDAKGAITGSTIVRDIPSLTSAATTAIQSWKFSPASSQGKPELSVIRVAIVFRPRSYYLAAGPTFAPILSEGDPKRVGQRYVPQVSFPLPILSTP